MVRCGLSRAGDGNSSGRKPQASGRLSRRSGLLGKAGPFRAPFQSILYLEGEGRTRLAPAIIEAVTNGKNEYDPEPFFYDRLTMPEAIEYRHEVMRDLENGAAIECVKCFTSDTHQYEFAHGFQVRNLPTVQLLRAERRQDGARTFRIPEGEPLRTSHGEDLYKRIFFGETGPSTAAPSYNQAAR